MRLRVEEGDTIALHEMGLMLSLCFMFPEVPPLLAEPLVEMQGLYCFAAQSVTINPDASALNKSTTARILFNI